MCLNRQLIGSQALAEGFAALVRNACRGIKQRSVHAILMARNFVVIRGNPHILLTSAEKTLHL